MFFIRHGDNDIILFFWFLLSKQLSDTPGYRVGRNQFVFDKHLACGWLCLLALLVSGLGMFEFFCQKISLFALIFHLVYVQYVGRNQLGLRFVSFGHDSHESRVHRFVQQLAPHRHGISRYPRFHHGRRFCRDRGSSTCRRGFQHRLHPLPRHISPHQFGVTCRCPPHQLMKRFFGGLIRVQRLCRYLPSIHLLNIAHLLVVSVNLRGNLVVHAQEGDQSNTSLFRKRAIQG
mmetsp:Transcript_24403/g.56832  ORF Transcript_24403/g.56832 Transcript_24403/m.56832 type:complete len:232 (-) Transcript_24403:825-1520(-)